MVLMVLAIFAITHKAVQIWGKNLSSTLQKKIQRYAQKNEKTDEYALSAFLIGQFGKNYQHKDALVRLFDCKDKFFRILRHIYI